MKGLSWPETCGTGGSWEEASRVKKLIALVCVVLGIAVGGGVFWQRQLHVEAATAALRTLNTSAKVLASDDFISDPSSNLATAQLNHVAYAKQQMRQYLSVLSNKQRAQYQAAEQQLTAAKVYTAIFEETHNVLGTDEVIMDQAYNNTTLMQAYARLKQNGPRYAKHIARKVQLVEQQVTALRKVQQVQTEPSSAQIEAARSAVTAVASPAFQQTYLPIVDEVASQQPAVKANTANTSPSATPAAGEAAEAKPNHDEQTPTTPAQTPATTSGEGYQQPVDDSVSTATPAASPDENDDSDEAAEEAVIGAGGLFDTMAEASAALKLAQAGSPNRPATAYSVVLADGSKHYTWDWLPSGN